MFRAFCGGPNFGRRSIRVSTMEVGTMLRRSTQLRRVAGVAAALALGLGTAGLASAQAIMPDGSPAVPESGDPMAVGSQPALPSCAERPGGGTGLGPATGPATGLGTGGDA